MIKNIYALILWITAQHGESEKKKAHLINTLKTRHVIKNRVSMLNGSSNNPPGILKDHAGYGPCFYEIYVLM